MGSGLMKFSKLFLVAIVSGFTVQAYSASYLCKQGSVERKIIVSYAGENKEMPCEVKYQKEGESEAIVKWSAQAETDYCEKKSDDFAEKLKALNWECEIQN